MTAPTSLQPPQYILTRLLSVHSWCSQSELDSKLHLKSAAEEAAMKQALSELS